MSLQLTLKKNCFQYLQPLFFVWNNTDKNFHVVEGKVNKSDVFYLLLKADIVSLFMY